MHGEQSLPHIPTAPLFSLPFLFTLIPKLVKSSPNIAHTPWAEAGRPPHSEVPERQCGDSSPQPVHPVRRPGLSALLPPSSPLSQDLQSQHSEASEES